MITKHFHTLEELALYVQGKPSTGSGRDDYKSVRSWDYGVGFDGAVRLALEGWSDGAAQVKRLLDVMPELTTQETFNETYRDVEGEYLDVDAWLAGIPECMVAFREDTRPAQVVRICASGSIQQGIHADEVMARGVAIVALVDALETQGIRCEVLWRKPHVGWQMTCTLKEANEPVNLDRLAFGLAHPAMNRRLNFTVQDLEPYTVQREHHLAGSGGYGNASWWEDEPGCINFKPLWNRGEWTLENAAQRVSDELARFAKEDAR